MHWAVPAFLTFVPLIAIGQTGPAIPKAWDERALQSMTLPVAGLGAPLRYSAADWYYQIPERQIQRGYPVYHPAKEPPGYLDWLRAQEPETAFDVSKLTREFDWIQAGESVFSSPDEIGVLTVDDIHDPSLWKKFRFTADAAGSLPGWRYVIRKKGEVELAATLCGRCHEGLVEGQTVAGTPNLALNGSRWAFTMRRRWNAAPDWEAAGRQVIARQFNLFTVPWLDPDPAGRMPSMTPAQLLAAYEAHSGGVAAVTGTSLFFPPRIPDLIGVKDRKYLGATGLYRNSGIADLMRYEALMVGAEEYTLYGDFRACGKLPDPAGLHRLSDAQLYALALYIYSLKPPANPNKLDTLAKRGQKIFDREGCPACHPAPLYTNNKLSPAAGLQVPKEAPDAMEGSAGTDPWLALQARKATGYYTVPPLKNIWYREPLEHNGSLASLEDWFDPMRIRDNYVPTGFKGFGVEVRAVKGHLFGLKLSFEERRALMAFVRTL